MQRLTTLLLLAGITFTAQAQTDCGLPHDINNNGSVDIEDFLSILGLFGDQDSDGDGLYDSQDNCIDSTACNFMEVDAEFCSYGDALGDCNGNCPMDEDGDGVCDFYSCGDPVSYQGYDYATVLIGEQCWFAENCRYLPAVSPSSAGSEIDGNGHAYVYGYEGQDVQEAQALENYGSYGVLYNRVAMQLWDVCPAGWHVPTDSNIGQGDFHELIAQFAETEVATELKSDLSSSPGWNGTNNSGFAALPAGARRVHSSLGYGFFASLGDETQYWAVETWSRRLTTNNPDLSFMGSSEHWGLSVRCIQD